MSKIFGQALLDDMVRTDSLPMPLVKQAAMEILAVIREGLVRDGVVKVSNFGTFRLKPVAARQGVNPQTGETITIPAQQRVIFTPGKALRDLIQPVYRPPQPIESQPSPRLDNGDDDETAPIEVKESGVMPGNTLVHTQGTARSSETSAVPRHQQPPAPSLRATSHEVTEKRVPVTPDAAPLPAAHASHSAPVTEDRENPATMAPRLDDREAAVLEAPASESPIEPPRIPSHEESILPPPSPRVSPVPTAAGQAEPEASNPGPNHRYTLSAAVILLIALIGIGMLRLNTEESPRQAVATTTPQPESMPASTIVVAEAPSPTAAQEVTSEPVANTAVNLMPRESPDLDQGVAPGVIAESHGADGTENNPGIESVLSSPIQTADYYFIERSHEIASGESLWRLARHHYRDPLLWPHIYQANTARIDNPDHLLVGVTITIPGLQGSPDRLTRLDRQKIAEGYYLAYLHYKNIGREDALFALLEAKRYDNSVVEGYRSQMRLSQADALQLMLQPTMPF